MDKLQEIMNSKRREVAPRIRPIRESELVRLAQNAHTRPSFYDRLKNPARLSVISEIKRRSPSAGDIAAQASAVEQARNYYNAGTDAISVLTDEPYFGGHIRDLWEVNDLLSGRPDTPPTLRKDFFFHPIQVVEAAEAGASAILIIIAALSDDEIRALYDAANLAKLDSLFEVHDLDELERALAFSPRIVGVNNRNLKTFQIDLATSEELIPQIPANMVRVCESGIRTVEDAERALNAGADTLLVGESLMRAENTEQFLRSLQLQR
jgi:indole-3-glycerol phosphate synthase